MSEIIIYQAYGEATSSAYTPTFDSWTISLPHKSANGGDSAVSSTLVRLARILAIAGILIFSVSFAPSVWYWAKGGAGDAVSELLYETSALPITDHQSQVTKVYQPRYDASLPQGAIIKVSSIGVETSVQEATRENFEEALRKGVWRANDSGTPYDRSKPTILAAHRFGYLAWSNTFRRKSSFFNLPKLAVGDTVEIAYKQRKYVYEVYGESRGENIDDYSADLVLYTCEDLTSPVRIFKYARLLEV